MAQAVAAEEAARATRTRSSPLAGVTYDPWAGELDLARFVPNATDVAIRTAVEQWHRLSPEAFAEIRSSLGMEDLYTLLTFARRSAVCSLRPDGTDWAVAGALALPAVACERVDWRDVTVAAGLVAWSLRATGHDPADVLHTASAMADDLVAKILERFAADPPSDPHEWGYAVIDTPDGRTLAETGEEPYRPTADLVRGALAIADALDQDRYRCDTITVAAGLPEVWFDGPNQAAAEAAIPGMLACVSVRGSARPGVATRPDSQMMLVLVAEMASPIDAEAVVVAANAAKRDHARLALNRGRVCCIAIARSFVAGVDPIETNQSLDRFRPELTRALHLIVG
jgi:hypothetical protein